MKYILITFATMIIVIAIIDNYNTSKTVRALSERMDSIIAVYEKSNHNCDSVLYELYGPNCPICGQPLKHYSDAPAR